MVRFPSAFGGVEKIRHIDVLAGNDPPKEAVLGRYLRPQFLRASALLPPVPDAPAHMQFYIAFSLLLLQSSFSSQSGRDSYVRR